MGACSLVLEDVGPNSVAVGVPAKVVGQTTDQVRGGGLMVVVYRVGGCGWVGGCQVRGVGLNGFGDVWMGCGWVELIAFLGLLRATGGRPLGC